MADIPECPIIGVDGVYGTVSNVLASLYGFAGGAYNIATRALDDLGDIGLDTIRFDVPFNTNEDWFKFVRPTGPDDPDLVWDPNPDQFPAPPSVSIPSPSFDAAPTFTGTAPVPDVHTPPGPLTAVMPDGPPALDPVEVPDAPVIVLPDFPELLDILPLPVAPDIQLPTFQGVRPNFNIRTPAPNFSFDAQQYDDDLLDEIKAKLRIMINGDVGLPTNAVNQMRDRAYVAVDEQAYRAEQEALEDEGARGWSTFSGNLAKRLAWIRQNNQNERNTLARDIYIKDVETAIEQLRFAVTQGIALEGQLLSAFVQIQAQMLEAAKFEMQITIDLFNAEVSLANLELQAYQADAAVFRDLIQASLAKVEVYKAQLEGKKLIGELNQQQVTVYTARVQALLSIIELYKAQIAGAEAKAQVNLVRTQAYVAQVQAYSEEVKAYETQWDAFAKQLEGDVSLYKRFELETEIFATRVKVWSDINENKIEQAKLGISAQDLNIGAYRARLERQSAALDAEAKRFDALVRYFGSKIQKYQADGAIEGIVSDASLRQMTTAIEQERTRVASAIQQVQIRITQAQEQEKILISKYQAIGQISGTMAAGAMSAMHVSAGVESRISQSFGCSTSFDYRIDGGTVASQ